MWRRLLVPGLAHGAQEAPQRPDAVSGLSAGAGGGQLPAPTHDHPTRHVPQRRQPDDQRAADGGRFASARE